jgi:urease accessory protein
MRRTSDQTPEAIGPDIVDRHSWKARLALDFEAGRQKTVLRRKHIGPLVIQRPFYPEGDVCHAYIVHPPGGVVGGDRLRLAVRCLKSASGLVTTPGANRFYGSDGRTAVQRQTLEMDDARFEWLPAESIFFDKAVVSQHTTIKLTRQSRFIGWDISCFGRLAGDHHFHTGHITNRFEVIREGIPVLFDRLHVADSIDLSRSSGMRGATVFGTMVIAAPDCIDGDMLDLIRERLPESPMRASMFGATQIDGLITVRYLGDNTERARDGFVQVWSAVRRAVMSGLAPTPPRIWAT